jgi:soluble lytic murein transglycosylase
VKFRLVLLLLPLLAILGGYWWWYQWRDHSQDIPILAAARRYGVEPALVKAVVWRESRFRPGKRGRAGEFGLMQIRPAAAGEWARAERIPAFSADTLLNPATNTLAGAWYLEKLLKRYAQTDDPLPFALADYNAGRANVLKWDHGPAQTNSAAFLNQITFPGTKSYIRSVIQRFDHYRPIFPPKPPNS